MIFAGLVLAMPAVGGAFAQAQKPKPRQAAMIIDGNTGAVLHNHNGDSSCYPASLTKVMTLYMVFSEIEAGRLSFSSRIKATKHSASMPPSKIGLKPGQTISVKDAVTALIVKSANDIAAAVGEHISGSEPAFARAMTRRAREIGMSSTTFFNASGLPDDRQKTTPRDMLTLALRIQDDFPQHYHLFSATSFTFAGKTHRSHNTLMKTFPGMDGMKTGYIRASGFNLVSSVRTGKKHIVGVVFGGKTAKVRNAHMQTILFQALERASTQRTRKGAGPMLVARQRSVPAQAAPPRVVAASVPMPIRAERPPVALAAKAPPRPAPAARPPDVIAQVLEEGDATTHGEADEGIETGSPRLDLAALRAAMSDNDGNATDAAPSREPQAFASASTSSGAKDIGSLIRNSLMDGEPQPHRARQPSSLDAQARALGVAVAALPNQRATAAAAGAFDVQIGAYTSEDEARRRLEHVRSRSGQLLAGYAGATIPVQADDRQVYRARFVNFDEQTATSACLELRRMAIDCLVMRAD